ncbi:unnamed protein product [Candidula unifasciata]|uniref:RNA exonuclease 4 n=1 Tax=Candidula unifasciata TaxID=100452 RepID=A0A8S4A210_9EUPU|nr:unnamed protein product [Candidula unifasciata]
MGQLFLVDDDDVTQEELLKQVSRKFILAARKRNSRISGKKQRNIKQKAKTSSVMSSLVTDSNIREIQSSSTYQACTSPTQPFQGAAGFRYEKKAVEKMQIDGNEKPGNSWQASLVKVNRKRTTASFIEGHSERNCSKRVRKNSCELLKDKLKRSICVAKSTPETGSCEEIYYVSSCDSEDENLEESPASSSKLAQPGYSLGLHKRRDQAKVGSNHVQNKKSGASVSARSVTYNGFTVWPNFDRKNKTKIKKQSNNLEKAEIRKYSGEQKLEESFTESGCSSSESGVSESRTPSSEWILHDRDNSFCLKRIFNTDGASAAAAIVLDGDDTSHQVIGGVRLPAVVDIPDWMYVAIDCEMVGVGPKGKKSVLARCSIVDYEGSVLYDKYIQPTETITDYRTPWSGIRPVHMNTAVSRDLALRDIKECLAHKVVIGHAVYHDFKVLGITPDHHFVRDTAQCAQLVEMAQLQGKGNGLKKLSEALLDRQIQVGRQGHCSVEDARATLDLFKLVRHSWEPALYLKWSQKEADICGKVARFVDNATRQRNSADNFLDDIFWPSDVTK